MFENRGWGHLLVLSLVGLIVLGPERLPGAIRWAFTAMRQAREYVSGATSQLRDEMGPEFDELRQPINELQKLRGMTPRAVLTQHLFDGDDSLFTAMSDLGAAPVSRTINDVPASVQSPAASADNPSIDEVRLRVATTPFDRDAT
jgi:sec-independent protein translocase protein TatB